jgi:hypothetical protein
MRRARIPLLFLSVALLGLSLWAFDHHDETGYSILETDFFTPSASHEEQDAQKKAYVKRIRADAYDRIERGDYENALVRLDQAAHYDRRMDMSPEVQEAREVIEQHLAASATPPSPSSTTSPPPAPSTAPSGWTSTFMGRRP